VRLIVFIVIEPLVCRYCDQPLAYEEAVVTRAYWWGNYFLCHERCKAPGEREEALECQKIDADCNDCRHFKRERAGKFTGSGVCLKFNQQTESYPHMSTGRPCFEHRRA
jgi:hypothetical protein